MVDVVSSRWHGPATESRLLFFVVLLFNATHHKTIWFGILVSPRLWTTYCLAMLRQCTFVFTVHGSAVMSLLLPWSANACQLVHITLPKWPKMPQTDPLLIESDSSYLLVKSSFSHAPSDVFFPMVKSRWWFLPVAAITTAKLFPFGRPYDSRKPEKSRNQPHHQWEFQDPKMEVR